MTNKNYSPSAPLRIYQLDLFRFIAAAMVVFYHYFNIGPSLNVYPVPFEAALPFARYGYLGVEWFFMISGFVITLSAENRTASAFLLGRFTRLFPLFWVCCTLTWLGVKALHGGPVLEASTQTYLINLSMLLPRFVREPWVDASYWTLSYEWVFYLGVALLLQVNHFNKYFSRYLCTWLAVSFLAAALSSHVPVHVYGALRQALMSEYAAYFVAGACFYQLYRGRATQLDVYNLCFAYLLAMKSTQMHAIEMFIKYQNPALPSVAMALVSVMFGLFLLLSLHRLEWLNQKRFLRFGALTYSFYLVHQFLGYSVIKQLQAYLPLPGAIAVTALGMLLLAWTIHLLIEKPAHKALQKLFGLKA